jgi:hypothetical protein
VANKLGSVEREQRLKDDDVCALRHHFVVVWLDMSVEKEFLNH